MNRMVHLINSVFILFLLSSINSSNAAGTSDTITIVKNLDQDWLIYNKKFNAYTYYLPEIHKNTHTVNQWLEVEKFKNYKLGFLADPGLVMFINNRLIYRNINHVQEKINFELKEFIKYQNNGRALLTFYNSNYKLPLQTTNIFKEVSAYSLIQQKYSSFKVLKRKRTTEIGKFVVAFLFVLTLIIIVKHRYTKRFNDFFTFQNVLANVWMEELSILKIYNSPILLILMINAILMSITTGVSGGFFFFFNLFGFIGNVESGLFRQLIACSFIYFAGLLIKYLLLNIISWVFNLSNIIKIQYFEFLKGILKLNIVIAAIAVIVASIFKTTDLQILHFIDHIFLLLFAFVVFKTAYLIFKLSTFRNIYLFSYLCTTEIMPLAIIIKIILFWNN